MGGDGPEAPPIQNSNFSDFGEIWIIYVNLHKKNNEIGQNSLGGHPRELRGAPVPIKNFDWL